MPDVMPAVDGQPWPTAQFARQSPTWAPSGVIGAPAAAYGSGDMALSFAVAGSVITVQMGIGRANCRGFLYERTLSPWVSGASGTQPTPGTAAYPLNTSSNPRIDRLVLRRDLGTQKVYPFIIQGTPAVSPQRPALTRVEDVVWDTPLFSWQLAGNSSTSISNIVDERAWVDPSGGGPVTFTARAARDAHFPNPVAGNACVCAGVSMHHDGFGWRFRLSGYFAKVADASGFVTTDALEFFGQAPLEYGAHPTMQDNDNVNRFMKAPLSWSANTIQLTFRVYRSDDDTPFAGNNIRLFWWARF